MYDLDLQDDPGDLDLYLAMAARADASVLELAAGSGRLAIPSAEAGHAVTAVDLDPAMLARAADAARDAGLEPDAVRLVEADLVDLRLPDAGTYGLAFVALNSIMLLADRVGPAGGVRDARRPPRTGRDRRSWTRGCPMPRTSPGSTAGSSSSGSGRTPRPATSSRRPDRPSMTQRPQRSS